jgi:hypothetical protein
LLKKRPATVGADEHAFTLNFRVLEVWVLAASPHGIVVAAEKLALAAYHRTFAALFALPHANFASEGKLFCNAARRAAKLSTPHLCCRGFTAPQVKAERFDFVFTLLCMLIIA